MRITIVMGFFLPMPPALGGATEKTWHGLAREFVARGHQVTIVSRRWPGWADEELVDGVRYVRFRGYDHRRVLWQNLALDFLWSTRVGRRLPAADVAVVHAVTLPIWLARRRPNAGRVVVMPGRMPKGQYRRYRGLARVIATSSPVRDRVLAENPLLADRTHVLGYPITYGALAQPRPTAPSGAVTIGYVGRLHPEKGLDLLVEAAGELRSKTNLPPWRLVICGPHTVAAGGGGESYRIALEIRLRQTQPAGGWELQPAFQDAARLAEHYRSLDVLCYPSLADAGETFGVAVAEAMAAGAAPLVSDLACFRDFVRAGENGLVFEHARPQASQRLAAALEQLLRNPAQRHALASAAQHAVAKYDLPRYADTLLADFATLAHQSEPTYKPGPSSIPNA